MTKKLNCVLLIDDDEPTNVLTSLVIEESGLAEHIRVAQGGQEALDYLAKSENPETAGPSFPSPDLVFLDINMPAMSGWEFLEKYKELRISDKIIIVMLTTSLFPEDRKRATQMQEIAGFEHKPLTPEIFEKIVEQHFAQQQASR